MACLIALLSNTWVGTTSGWYSSGKNNGKKLESEQTKNIYIFKKARKIRKVRENQLMKNRKLFSRCSFEFWLDPDNGLDQEDSEND